jgi:hypothetical protein
LGKWLLLRLPGQLLLRLDLSLPACTLLHY